MNNKTTYITCSAIWFDDGKEYIHQPFNIESGFVICGHRHHNCFASAFILNNGKIKDMKDVQGFMTNKNNFVDRKEAAHIAFNSGQTSKLMKRLFSEDIY